MASATFFSTLNSGLPPCVSCTGPLFFVRPPLVAQYGTWQGSSKRLMQSWDSKF